MLTIPKLNLNKILRTATIFEKTARGLGASRFKPLLYQTIPSTSSWVEISKSALEHNFTTLKNILGSTALGIVLKGNAYGHGLLPIATLAQEHAAVEWLFTINLQEAVFLRHHGITKSLLVLGFIDLAPLLALEHMIDLPVYDHTTAYELNQCAQAHGKKFSVHVKVDTGLARLGIMSHDVLSFFKQLKTYTGLEVKGIFTHLADTTNSDPSNTLQQLASFDALLASLQEERLLPPLTHALASGALALPLQKKYSLARIGGSCYGLWKTAVYQQRFYTTYPSATLYPALHWKSKISLIKHVPAHTSIGYGFTYTTKVPTTLAIIPVGYADGYPRVSSHTVCIAIRGYRAPVIGVVSMNMLIVDITHIPFQVTIGTEVTLLGGSMEKSYISVEEFAIQCNTIGNEIVTRINNTIPRIIL